MAESTSKESKLTTPSTAKVLGVSGGCRKEGA